MKSVRVDTKGETYPEPKKLKDPYGRFLICGAFAGGSASPPPAQPIFFDPGRTGFDGGSEAE